MTDRGSSRRKDNRMSWKHYHVNGEAVTLLNVDTCETCGRRIQAANAVGGCLAETTKYVRLGMRKIDTLPPEGYHDEESGMEKCDREDCSSTYKSTLLANAQKADADHEAAVLQRDHSQPDTSIAVGDVVRSFDFEYRDTEGERACFVEGIVREICDPCQIVEFPHYRIEIVRSVMNGEEYKRRQEFVFPPVNGTPKLFGGVTDGVVKLEGDDQSGVGHAMLQEGLQEIVDNTSAPKGVSRRAVDNAINLLMCYGFDDSYDRKTVEHALKNIEGITGGGAGEIFIERMNKCGGGAMEAYAIYGAIALEGGAA